MDKLAITIGGGTRGLGLAILEEFKRYGYEATAFHCREDKEIAGENSFFDANLDESLEVTKARILEAIAKSERYKEIIIVFLTGGGNPSGSEPEAKETKALKAKRIYRHNYGVPTEITDLIEEKSAKEGWGKEVKLVFLSSSAAMHKKADPHYCAAKSALETYFQAKFKQKKSKMKMYLYRLGMVDVRHKYLHSLSVERPEEFKKLLEESVPSNHFSQPEEIARVIGKTVLDSNTCDGIICDLSGGNSWQ